MTLISRSVRFLSGVFLTTYGTVVGDTYGMVAGVVLVVSLMPMVNPFAPFKSTGKW